MKCPKCNDSMEVNATKAGVLIDKCKSCKGIWLNSDELQFFLDKTQKSNYIEFIANGLQDKKVTQLNCPSCNDKKLHEGLYPNSDILLDQCNECSGLYFDKLELTKLSKTKVRKNVIKNKNKKFQIDLTSNSLIKLPSLRLTSLSVLGGLYLTLIVFFIFLIEANFISELTGIISVISVVAFQFLFGPFLMDISLKFLGKMTWYNLHELPRHLSKFIIKLTDEKKIAIPRIGIIDDSAPNAFTYGVTPRNARIVLSKGILELLEEEEVEAVVAHEIGHIYHWDFVFMTLANTVPLIFYQIYRMFHKISSSKKSDNSKNNNSTAQLAVVAYIAYILYIVSEYIILYLSRTREYWADRFGAKAVKNPNALASALIKISYGLLDDSKNTVSKRNAIKALGISNTDNAHINALLYNQNDIDESHTFEKHSTDVMKWDLWNPWAGYYELHSTHPLNAKRINSLSNLAINMNIEPKFLFNFEQPESYWDEFLVDICVGLAPLIGALFPVLLNFNNLINREIDPNLAFQIFAGFSLGGLISAYKRYHKGNVKLRNIRSLLKVIKVSGVRPVPVKLKGTIIGRGDPGYIFSEDFVLKDKTGIIFLDYQQPLALFNFLFSVFRANQWQGKEVTVTGWYRRSPTPYVEVQTISSEYDSSTCYTYHVTMLFWWFLSVFSLSLYFFKK